MCFPSDICNYTEAGRTKIHSLQKAIDPWTLQQLMQNPIRGKSAELNDNRISLYVAQRGKCAITGDALELGDMNVHHIIPTHLQGDDRYANLVLLTSDAHKLVHAIQEETVQKYLLKLQNCTIHFQRLNKMRKHAGLSEISTNR
ncbi:hypothetical protein L7E55_16495 [Pelotomaculum isophthalicicum JI]|uniref:HNH nuclease domain-containing protein n=1 Tax=Pelotomaculum isophthalicicum JI TaxID=947010 RepID=A0A9X4JUV5_9FIRM|nr:hypothetical protein [Pelotomaculum isophthalicicum]MDF9409925.1 hypothetical protein [Pelotomaculum isophthalicicum JI]